MILVERCAGIAPTRSANGKNGRGDKQGPRVRLEAKQSRPRLLPAAVISSNNNIVVMKQISSWA
jgi:hypothetical protein